MDEINRPAIHKEKKYDKQEDVIIGLSSIIFHDQRKLIRKKIQRQIISRLKSRTTFNIRMVVEKRWPPFSDP
jgi:uncharacterized coiled-coil protein SlyX